MMRRSGFTTAVFLLACLGTAGCAGQRQGDLDSWAHEGSGNGWLVVSLSGETDSNLSIALDLTWNPTTLSTLQIYDLSPGLPARQVFMGLPYDDGRNLGGDGVVAIGLGGTGVAVPGLGADAEHFLFLLDFRPQTEFTRLMLSWTGLPAQFRFEIAGSQSVQSWLTGSTTQGVHFGEADGTHVTTPGGGAWSERIASPGLDDYAVASLFVSRSSEGSGTVSVESPSITRTFDLSTADLACPACLHQFSVLAHDSGPLRVEGSFVGNTRQVEVFAILTTVPKTAVAGLDPGLVVIEHGT